MALGCTQCGRVTLWSVPKRQLDASEARCLNRILASALPLPASGWRGVWERLHRSHFPNQ